MHEGKRVCREYNADSWRADGGSREWRMNRVWGLQGSERSYLQSTLSL